MVPKLDAHVPRVWRTPYTLQFGVERARIVLENVSDSDEQLIHALESGVARPGLGMIARTLGVEPARMNEILTLIAPVLEPEDLPSNSERSRPVVDVVGSGLTADLIAQTLISEGVDVPPKGSGPADTCDLAVAVSHYVIEPYLFGHWLRADIPHLPVVFTDAGVTIGPLVEPGVGPCLYCLHRQRIDADPEWLAIVSQLWGRRSPSETVLLAHDTAARVSRMVLQRLADGTPRPASSIRINRSDGTVTTRAERPHPQCDCLDGGEGGNNAAFAGAQTEASEVRPETDSPGESDPDAHPPQPTTATASSAPG
jgi:bacteriocin biosynthesis cyclodehydratase domain-containing protein